MARIPTPWLLSHQVLFVKADLGGGQTVDHLLGSFTNPEDCAFAHRAVNAHEALLHALKECLPLLEKLEDETLVGDEGCLWPVEFARAAIAEGEPL